jgi:hypothetical protein
MKPCVKFIFAGLFAVGVATSSTSAALAWGCAAVAADGDTYGYSYEYDYQDDAAERALDECAALTPEDDVCVIVECDPDE